MKTFLPLLTLALCLTFLAACTDSALVDSPNDLNLDVASKGGPEKVAVCHLSETGDFVLLGVNDNALPGHLGHGDGLPGDPKPGDAGKKFAEDCSVVDAISVTPGQPARARGAGLRIKGFNSGGEIFIGPMTSSSALPRSEGQYNDFQTVGQKTYDFSFSFEPVSQVLSMTITSPDQSVSYDLNNGAGGGCASSGWDTMDIFIRDDRTDSGVALQNLDLEGTNLGNLGAIDKLGKPGGQYWGVTGFDFSTAWTLSGDLAVDGYTGNEGIKVEFTVGCGL